MSARIGRRNNILAGLFLIGSLLLAVVMSFMLSGLTERLGAAHRYHVWFPVSVGAPGIKPGSPVHLGGQPVGRVDAVERRMDGPEGGRIILKVSIAHDLVLYPDAKAYLEQPLLGTLSTINIRSLGTSAAGPALTPGAEILGGMAPPAFLESAGFGTEQQEKVQNIIDLAEQFMERLHASMEETDARLQPILERAERISADVESVVARVSGSLDGWIEQIDGTLASIQAGSDRIDPFFAEAETAMADARALLASAQGVVDDGRPKVDTILTNVETTTRRVNDETLPLVNRTIEDYRAPAADATAVLADIQALIAQEMPNIRRAIANLRLTSDQLKLTIAEVRAAPWRLLERPTTRELQAQLFYDATRAYAEAVSDLRAASEALTAARASGLPRPDDLQGLLDHLQQAFEAYEEAEARMLRQIPRVSP